MSTIHCTERNCFYQKDGTCFLNTITPTVVKDYGRVCIYFRDKNQEVKQENEEQIQKK